MQRRTLQFFPERVRQFAFLAHALCQVKAFLRRGMASDSVDDDLDLQEIELEQEKLALQRQELQLRERKLSVLRKRKGGGMAVFSNSWRGSLARLVTSCSSLACVTL